MLFFITVLILLGGFFAMKMLLNRGIAQITAADAKSLINDPEVTILDVRTHGEFDEGHLSKARLIPVAELKNRLPEIVSLKERPVLVYCHSGNRSSIACQILKRNGFTNLTNLRGGIAAWQGRGNEVVREK